MNFIVWSRGSKGHPTAALHLLDPRNLMSWKEQEQSAIAVIPLLEHERDYTLAQAVAAHPCPVVA